jgi:ATP-dependent exoDNAse (exonuclease V) beta subunit
MATPEPAGPPDQAARDRIVADLDSTLFVEAGAGSGKTRALVERVVALVATGAAELSAIAAITFTEKAGAELRDRLRRVLQERASTDTDAIVADRCRTALDQLDSAAIGTLHSFAQRILSESPIEAGLPPKVEVLDEVSSGVEFDRRWSTFREELLKDPALERTILLLMATGVKPAALDALARAFEADWDLVSDHVPPVATEPPSGLAGLDRALRALEAACAERVHCTNPDDLLFERLDRLADHAAFLRTLDDELDLVEALDPDGAAKPPSFKVRKVGNQNNWPDVNAVRQAVNAAGDALGQVRDKVANACAHRLGVAIRAFTLNAADERRAAGQLEFHDLLVLARAVMRDPVSGATVRARLHQRYQRLLLDEFQDTDPIQIELAVRIAASDPQSEAAGLARWDQVPVAPGHLFVVGDPKQSIYRFRRADIATFLRARDRFGPDSGGAVPLTTNFRTVEEVIDWINHVFGDLIRQSSPLTGIASQPDYIPLAAERGTPSQGPPISVVGRGPLPAVTTADELRIAEAGDVAAAVACVVNDGWTVDDGAEGWRRARLADITVLVPARTSLPFLQDAFDARHIAYRAESSSLVYATRAVRDIIMVLRAVSDPTNQLHTLAALRTPLLGCGDDDLFRFRVERHGRWSYLADQPDTVPTDDPVHAGLVYMRSLHDQRHWQAPSELLDRIARDRRAFELGFAEGRPRDVWRRLRFVIDQARAWSEATNGNLRQYLHWVELQSAEGVRVSESILPETDDDAVRIMTIHAAKGLEFPITIVSGMSTAPSRRPSAAEVVFPPDGGVGYHFGNKIQTDEYLAWKPIDELMGYDERKRLLYVACTRARDHLVVSVTRRSRQKPVADPAKRTNAELLVDGMGVLLHTVPDAVGGPVADLPPVTVVRPSALSSLAAWRAEHGDALTRGTRPTVIAATALTDEGAPDPASERQAGLQKRPRDLDLPPWLKGRYGTSVGRAVHGTLQTIDLATGAGIEAALSAQCEAEAIPERAAEVRELVTAALESPCVREAAGHPHWREVYACTSVEGRLLEGYIDLLYRGPGGLVVVDHKTAATDDPDELDRRVHGYRLQGASYALVIAAATAEAVSRVTFLFLTPSGAIERDLVHLDAAMEEVRTLIRAGHEVTVDEPATVA